VSVQYESDRHCIRLEQKTKAQGGGMINGVEKTKHFNAEWKKAAPAAFYTKNRGHMITRDQIVQLLKRKTALCRFR